MRGHRPAAPNLTVSVLLSHHQYAHATQLRQPHSATDGTVALDSAAQAVADGAAAADTEALTLALSLLALQTPRGFADTGRHVLQPSAPCF